MTTLPQYQDAHTKAEAVAQLCQQPHAQGDGSWMVACPSHEDGTPSLHITPAEDGLKVLLNCFAGCLSETILAALGLGWADLFITTPSARTNGHQRIEAVYDYVDEAGTVLYQSVRLVPKAFFQRRPDATQPGGYRTGKGCMRGVRKVLFQLSEVLRAKADGRPIYVVEGEKDALALRAGGLTATCNVGGAGKWDRTYTTALAGANIVLVPDNDEPGRQHAVTVAQALQGRTASLKVVELPGLPEHGDVSDWLRQGQTMPALEALMAAAPRWEPSPAVLGPPGDGETSSAGKPVIRLDTNLSRWTDEGQAALRALTTAHGAPVLFQRARRPVLIAAGVKPPRWLHRPPDAPIIVEASEAALYELASRAASWQKWDKRQEDWETILPPRLFVPTLLGRPVSVFPPLEGVVHTPSLRPDGTVISQPGYDQASGLFFAASGTTFPPVPDAPDLFDVQSALHLLKDVLGDFPWAQAYDCVAALAAILTGVCRYAVLGNVPLFGISSSTRASGKGYLADVIALIATGRRAPLWSQAEDDAEERKRLLTLGMDGDPLVVIDNVTRPLGSAPLDLALTSSTFKDRILGTQTSKEVPMNCLFLACGNNLQFVGDLARRVVPITLDPRVEKPEERTGFKYPDLLAHVTAHRPQLVCAALTILKGYYAAGRPAQGLTPYGSFQEWSDLVRAALAWAGEGDCCEGRKTIEAQDPGHEALAGLLACWAACYPAGDTLTLKRLARDIAAYKDAGVPLPAPNTWDDLEQAVFEFDQGSARGKALNLRTLGHALKRVQGRIIAYKRFVSAGTYQNALQWKIETMKEPGSSSL